MLLFPVFIGLGLLSLFISFFFSFKVSELSSLLLILLMLLMLLKSLTSFLFRLLLGIGIFRLLFPILLSWIYLLIISISSSSSSFLSSFSESSDNSNNSLLLNIFLISFSASFCKFNKLTRSYLSLSFELLSNFFFELISKSFSLILLLF